MPVPPHDPRPRRTLDDIRAELRALRRQFDEVHAERLATLQRQDAYAAAELLRCEQAISEEYDALLRMAVSGVLPHRSE